MVLTDVTTSIRIATLDAGTSYLTGDGAHMDGAHGRAIDQLVVTWGRSHGLGHPEPGSIKFSVLTAVGAAASWAMWESEVTVTVTRPGWPVLTVAVGWITEIDRTVITLADGTQRWRWVVTCHDILGRAAATSIDIERDPETAEARMSAINAAASSAVGILADTSGLWGRTVGALAAGRSSALDLIRRTVDYDSVAGETDQAMIGSSRLTAGTVSVGPVEEPYLAFTGPASTSTSIPATAVEDTGRRLDRAAKTDSITVTYVDTYVDDAGVETTVTLLPPFPSGTSSDLAIVTDHRLDLPELQLLAGLRAAITEAHHPTYQLPGAVRVATDQLSYAQLRALVGINQRSGTVIYIDGAPDDLEHVHVLLGGTLTVTGRELRLAIEVQPGRVSGVRQLRYRETRDQDTGTKAVFRGSTYSIRRSLAIRIGAS